mmetsp:Transcript_1959/g.5489  ORF Transcript_1959/g.5489 Transcript_1959/m.5489 type:complete len:217 (-) Transcript_1959:844-1494(-)
MPRAAQWARCSRRWPRRASWARRRPSTSSAGGPAARSLAPGPPPATTCRCRRPGLRGPCAAPAPPLWPPPAARGASIPAAEAPRAALAGSAPTTDAKPQRPRPERPPRARGLQRPGARPSHSRRAQRAPLRMSPVPGPRRRLAGSFARVESATPQRAARARSGKAAAKRNRATNASCRRRSAARARRDARGRSPRCSRRRAITSATSACPATSAAS